MTKILHKIKTGLFKNLLIDSNLKNCIAGVYAKRLCDWFFTQNLHTVISKKTLSAGQNR